MWNTQTDRSAQLYMKKIAAMDKNGYYLTQKVQFSILETKKLVRFDLDKDITTEVFTLILRPGQHWNV